MKTNTILTIIAAVTLVVVVIMQATQPDDLNGYMPCSDYVHSQIPDLKP